MALFSRVKTWVSNEVLTAANLNAEFDNIINNLAADKVSGASGSVSDMQAVSDPGGLGTESQASDLAGEFKRLRYKIKQLMNGAYWYSTPLGSLSTGGIVAANLATDSVETLKIKDANVTRPKLEAVGQQTSVTGAYSLNSAATTLTNGTTNLTVTITTTGRPVRLLLVPVLTGVIDDTTNLSNNFAQVSVVSAAAKAQVRFAIKRVTSAVETRVWDELVFNGNGFPSYSLTHNAVADSAGTPATITLTLGSVGRVNASFALSCFQAFDAPAAGTHAYRIQFANYGGDGTVTVSNVKLVAYEL